MVFNQKKSFWEDFLVLFGIIPVEFPVRPKQKVKRIGYPTEYITVLSEQKRKRIKEDAQKMANIVNSANG